MGISKPIPSCFSDEERGVNNMIEEAIVTLASNVDEALILVGLFTVLKLTYGFITRKR
jgi:hypothetical protein